MREWPDLTALELIVAVADHGSLSAGARTIGMAQPNASRSLARLERSLGVPLVVRSTAGARLTPAGLLVVDWARQVLASASTLVDGAAGLAAGGGDGLAVSASQTVAEHLLPAWLAHLHTEHPGVAVDVAVHNTAGVVEDVLAGVCNVGFVEGPRAPSGVHSRVVAVDELVLVVAPQHPWAQRTGVLPAAELAGTPLLTRESGSGTRVMLDEALAEQVGRSAVAAQELGSNAAVRVAVQSGAGPAVLSRLAVADGLRAGTLLEVPLALDLRRHLRAVWTGPRRLTGLAADLVDIAARPRRS